MLLENVFYDSEWYIFYPHFGKHKDNEHFHIYVPATDQAGKQRYRDRIKNNVGAGNRHFSAKSFKNGLAQAIQYGSKEGTDPTTKGEFVQQWIDDSPPWVPGAATRKRKRPSTAIDIDGEEIELGVQLNKYNIIPFAASFYKKNRFKHKSWRKTILAMIESNKYRWTFTEELGNFCEPFWLMQIDPDYKNAEVCSRLLLGFDFTNPVSINVDDMKDEEGQNGVS